MRPKTLVIDDGPAQHITLRWNNASAMSLATKLLRAITNSLFYGVQSPCLPNSKCIDFPLPAYAFMMIERSLPREFPCWKKIEDSHGKLNRPSNSPAVPCQKPLLLRQMGQNICLWPQFVFIYRHFDYITNLRLPAPGSNKRTVSQPTKIYIYR